MSPAPSASGFSFDQVWLSKLRFEDTTDEPPAKRQVDLELGVAVEVAEDESQATVTLSLNVKPAGPSDHRVLEIVLEGRFAATSEEARKKLREFAERQGAALLVPFAREIVSNVTSRARSGPLLLPPLNVYNLVPEKRGT